MLQSPSLPDNLVEQKSIDVLGIRIDLLEKKEILERAERMFRSDWPHQIITANALLILETQKNALLKSACDRAAMVIPDSSGIRWAAKNLGHPIVSKYPGIDLAYDLCSLAELAGHQVFLLGGKPGVAEQAAKKLAIDFPYLGIGGIRDGFFKDSETDHIIKSIIQSRSRLVMVALGMPRQDTWIYQNLSKFPPGIYVGIGGSFDIWAGHLKRAPSWMQNAGLEWLFRLKQEPSRFNRILQLPRFVFKVIQKGANLDR